MDLKVLKDAKFLMKSEMAVVAGGAMSGCSSCCDKENGGTNQQQQELEKGDKSHDYFLKREGAPLIKMTHPL